MVKLFGPPRSGTNYLAYVVERNFHTTVAQYRKHNMPFTTISAKGYLLIEKSVFAWITSMRRYSRAHLFGDNSLEALCEKWLWYKDKYQGFVDLYADNTVYIDYMNLLTDFEETMDRIKNTLRLLPKETPYVNQPNTMLRGSDLKKGEEAVSDEPFDNKSYLQNEFMLPFTEAERDYIEKQCQAYM